LERPSTSAGDPDGEQRLNVDLGADSDSAPGPMFHHIAARTKFFDDLTLAAIDSGVSQIVIIGAGYDGRALRFRHPAVRFYELDHPVTQRDKRQRLARLGIDGSDVRYVPIDLTIGAVDAVLRDAGHDAAQPSLFIGEGLLLYLDAAVIERMFRGARLQATGSATLALSLALRDRVVADPNAALRRAALHRRLRALGEPPRTMLARGEWEALLGTTGWALDRAVDPHTIDPEAPAGGALLVTALAAGCAS
jgi:methyltransferase (TIGR00027 family)